MSILSVVAVCRLAERHVRQTGGLVPVEAVVARLASYGVDVDRARAGCRLAVVVGRLTETSDTAGHRCLRVPSARAA